MGTSRSMIFKLAHASKGKSASELIGAASSQNTCVLSPTGHFRNFWDFLGALDCNDVLAGLGVSSHCCCERRRTIRGTLSKEV